jgi:hypothetical protein
LTRAACCTLELACEPRRHPNPTAVCLRSPLTESFPQASQVRHLRSWAVADERA